LVINFFPNKCLGDLVVMFLAPCGPFDVRQCCYGLLESWRWWRCHWWPFCLLDLLINVIIMTIYGPIQMLTVDVRFKYVLRRTILKSYSQPECWWVWSYTYPHLCHLWVLCKRCYWCYVVGVVGHVIHCLILEGFLWHALMVHGWMVPWQEVG
jgi:hypothetical protein